ncbi:MAG: DUF5058 family protein [Clostridia bacterium]|nr:DUF5058 family protein [Clostridia bacterium]
MDFREDSFMLILALAVIAFVLVQSAAFLLKAWKQGKRIGLSSATMKNTVIQSVLFTITPALAIVATVIALAPALGIILPWIRLSVIGNISQETAAATAAIEATGAGGITVPITDKTTFATVMWVMTLASSLPLIVLPLTLKRLQRGVKKAVSKAANPVLTDALAAAAFIGLIAAFIAKALAGVGTCAVDADGVITYNYDGAGLLSVATLISSVVIMLILSKIAEKHNVNWLKNFAMPISMFAAMGIAILLTQLLPESIAHFEFRPPVVS